MQKSGAFFGSPIIRIIECLGPFWCQKPLHGLRWSHNLPTHCQIPPKSMASAWHGGAQTCQRFKHAAGQALWTLHLHFLSKAQESVLAPKNPHKPHLTCDIAPANKSALLLRTEVTLFVWKMSSKRTQMDAAQTMQVRFF